MELKQLSIFVENKAGRMAEITKVLAENKIDIRALSIADTADYGIFRLIVNKPEAALEVLRGNNITVSLTSVIAVSIADRPGSLHKAVTILSENNISIEYMYAFLNPKSDTACVILRVEDNDAAIKALTENGVSIIESDSLYEM